MSEEKKLILQMLKEGKITVDEAEKLLETGEEDTNRVTQSTNKKFLRVQVTEGDKNIVNINIPVALAEAGLKLVPKERLKIEGAGINVNEILQMIKDGSMGELVNVDTVDKGKELKVKIFVG